MCDGGGRGLANKRWGITVCRERAWRYAEERRDMAVSRWRRNDGMQRREGYDGMQRRRDMAVSRWRRNDGMQRREGNGGKKMERGACRYVT